MTFRNLARVGATGLLVAGTLAFAAVPAFAADVDYGISLKGTTIAADASGKLGVATVTNEGLTAVPEVEVVFDGTKLDPAKVTLADLDSECKAVDMMVACLISPAPAPGESLEIPVPLARKDGGTGDAGSVTVTVKAAGDTNPDNDSATAEVTVGDHGVDLTLIAPDVYSLPADDTAAGPEAIPPGGQGLLVGIILNQGDAVADGLKLTFSVPTGVTLDEDIPGCAYSADRRSAACSFGDVSLIPRSDDGQDGERSTAAFFTSVTVSKDAKGPAVLKGGEMSVAAIDQQVVSDAGLKAMARQSAPRLPKNFRHLSATEIKDVDATDNTDTFAVFVAGPQASPSPSEGNGGPAGGGDGLPITGPVAGTVAGAGAGIIAIGAVLFVMTRRRRVVLVNPGDEK